MGDRPIESWESLAERRIREAAQEGAFDDLPGSIGNVAARIRALLGDS